MSRSIQAVFVALCLVALVVGVVVLHMSHQHSFRTVEGIDVPNLKGVHEAYSVSKTTNGYHHLIINVSAERVPEVYLRLTHEVTEPAFFLMEVGTHEDVEKELRKNDSDPFHKDVYYLDGINREKGCAVFTKYEDLLVNDGMVMFGFGAHEGKDEVFVGAYKIIEIYADNPDKYLAALTELGIGKEDRVKTVWQTFSQTSPGRRNALRGRDKTIWDMVEELKPEGLYLAERRED